MRPPGVFVRDLAPHEGQRLKRLSKRAKHASTRQRASILLASNTLMSAPQIARMWMTDESHVRRVIHEFNEHGFESLRPRFGGGRPRRISTDDEQRIVAVAGARPDSLGVPYTRWEPGEALPLPAWPGNRGLAGAAWPAPRPQRDLAAAHAQLEAEPRPGLRAEARADCYTWPYPSDGGPGSPSWGKVEVRLHTTGSGFFTGVFGLASEFFKPAARAVVSAMGIAHCVIAGQDYGNLSPCQLTGAISGGNGGGEYGGAYIYGDQDVTITGGTRLEEPVYAGRDLVLKQPIGSIARIIAVGLNGTGAVRRSAGGIIGDGPLTTLAADLTINNTTSMRVTNNANFLLPGTVKIDDEWIKYTGAPNSPERLGGTTVPRSPGPGSGAPSSGHLQWSLGQCARLEL